MSKSLGTGIDPLEAVDMHGADATRYGLLKISSTQDVRFSAASSRRAASSRTSSGTSRRLILANVDGESPDERPQALEERWILGRLAQTQRRARGRLLAEFDFAHAAQELYQLTFDDFCDWYAEGVKPRLYDGDADARATALAALERLLKLLHPVMPHVTEEIWTSLPARATRLIVAPWPEATDAYDADADALRRVQEAAERFRRSGVTTPLEGEEQRIFAVVVKPERAKANGTPRPRSSGCAERSRAPRQCSRTIVSRRTRPSTSLRPSARSSTASGGSSMRIGG